MKNPDSPSNFSNRFPEIFEKNKFLLTKVLPLVTAGLCLVQFSSFMSSKIADNSYVDLQVVRPKVSIDAQKVEINPQTLDSLRALEMEDYFIKEIRQLQQEMQVQISFPEKTYQVTTPFLPTKTEEVYKVLNWLESYKNLHNLFVVGRIAPKHIDLVYEIKEVDIAAYNHYQENRLVFALENFISKHISTVS